MAATKVDVRPPSTYKDQWSGSFCETSSSMSGLNAISSPKLNGRRFGGFATPPLALSAPKYQQPSHMMYKAASFPQREGLVADFCRNGVTGTDGRSCSGCELGECCDIRKGDDTSSSFSPGAVFGLFGALSFHPLNSFGKIGLVSSHQFNTPPLLFPVLNHCKPRAGGEESLFVPTLSHFEVKSTPEMHDGESQVQKKGNGKKGNGFVSHSKGMQQLFQQNASVSMSGNRPDMGPFTLPPVESSPTSKGTPEEASAGETKYPFLSNEAACSDDEIPAICTDIHSPLNEIHGADEGGECCYSDFDGADFVVDDEPTTSAHKEHPSSTEPDSHTAKATLKVDHLVIDGKRELRKLLSDESGFYDISSPCDVPVSLNGWWQKDCLRLSCDDDGDQEDVEWDDEDGEDDGCEVDESADDLWKSFEVSMLSPQCLMMRPQSPKTPLTPLTPHTPLTPQNQVFGTIDSQSASSAKSKDKIQSDVVAGHLTPEQWRAGQNKAHLPTNSHHCETNYDVATAECPVSRSRKRQVHFPSDSEISVVHEIVAWNFAYRAARKGPWEQCARDRAHFRRRIDNLASVLEPCLTSKIAKMAARRAQDSTPTEPTPGDIAASFKTSIILCASK